MAFGQQQGRPASARQIKALESLLADAGYLGFREARGPMGFNQRQGGGKFTDVEADTYISQLQAEAEAGVEAGSGLAAVDDAKPASPAPRARRVSPVPKTTPGRPASGAPAPETPAGGTVAQRRQSRQAALVRELPAKILAHELEGRGWILIPPEDLTATDPTADPPTSEPGPGGASD
jgi:hypothetical protein